MIPTQENYSAQVTRTLTTNQSGQSAIEFILVIALALGITFLFMSQAFNATQGYLVHYVNYVGSRVYLTYDRGSTSVETNFNEAQRIVEAKWNTYNLREGFGIDPECEFSDYRNTNGLFTGTICSFEAETNFFPTIGGGDKANLESESFLGKEPVRATCFEMTCAAVTGNRNGCDGGQSEDMDITLYDNGC